MMGKSAKSEYFNLEAVVFLSLFRSPILNIHVFSLCDFTLTINLKMNTQIASTLLIAHDDVK
jgi:hypothetical protein